MKAAFLTGVRSLEVRETPDPQLTDSHDVLVRVDTVGVCGSDVHYYLNGRIGSQAVGYPERVGHECAGTVVASGDSLAGLKVSQRVAIDPLIPCGRCDQCRIGRPHTCRKQGFLGCPGQAPGALAEYLVMPAQCCHPIPQSMSLVQAALVEPFSIGLYAQRVSGLEAGAKLAILGSGPIGACVLLACRAAGAGPIYATDLVDERLDLARRLGADWTGNPERMDITAILNELEPMGLDFVFECAGEQQTLNQAVDLLKPGGTLLIIGIPEADRVSFNVHELRRKEIRVYNIRRQNGCIAPAIHMMATRAVNADNLVTHHFPMADVKRAFDLVASRGDGVLKAIIDVSSQALSAQRQRSLRTLE
jgi:L-iditol 2-dehydrogenase